MATKATPDRSVIIKDLAKQIAAVGIEFGYHLAPIAASDPQIGKIERLLIQAGRETAELATRLRARAEADKPLPLFDRVENPPPVIVPPPVVVAEQPPPVGDVVRPATTTRPLTLVEKIKAAKAKPTTPEKPAAAWVAFAGLLIPAFRIHVETREEAEAIVKSKGFYQGPALDSLRLVADPENLTNPVPDLETLNIGQAGACWDWAEAKFKAKEDRAWAEFMAAGESKPAELESEPDSSPIITFVAVHTQTGKQLFTARSTSVEEVVEYCGVCLTDDQIAELTIRPWKDDEADLPDWEEFNLDDWPVDGLKPSSKPRRRKAVKA